MGEQLANILGFSIANFRGADSVYIDLGVRHRSPIVTLIGLNESGKTTILEAISYFSGYDTALDEVLDHKESRQALHSFIPVSQEAVFTGDVEIEADLELTADDRKRIAQIVASKGGQLIFDSVPNKVKVSVKYKFENSRYIESKYASYWTGANFKYVPNGKRKPVSIDASSSSTKDIWQVIVADIKSSLPQIVYFPTFLVDMPTRIYLEKIGTEDDLKNDYYFKILQNIAAATDEKIDLNEHVVERIHAFEKEDGTSGWMQNLSRSVQRRPINAVFAQMGAQVSRQILSSWKDVIGRPINIDRISFEWNVDPDFGNAVYVSINIHDRESDYDLKQRSLGFRWFFSFLLFTVFGGSPGKKKLFLFDEPAANLHVRAQQQLLKSFSYLVGRGDSIIYSTHSSHMIDEHTLSGAYIVENRAVDLDDDDIGGYAPRPTDIKVVPYRNFVGENPKRTNYFQPVLERLQHVVSPMALERPALIVEGPSDFYALSYVRSLRLPDSAWDIVPSESAGKCGPLIGLYLGRGLRFSVMLDDDAAGRKERDRYRETWHLSNAEVFTLGELLPSLAGKQIEGLLDEETLDMIRGKFGGKSEKKIVGLYLSEACARREPGWLSKATEEVFFQVLTDIDAKLSR